MRTQSLIAAVTALTTTVLAVPAPQAARKFPKGFGPRPIRPSSNSTHHPDATSPDAAASTFYSSNWAGIIQSGSGIDYAVGTFTIPTCSPGPSGSGPWYNAYWVGIDGYENGEALLQAGVICEVDSSGATSYYPWVEYFPTSLITLDGFPMASGDSVTVGITVLTPTSGEIVLADQTTGQSFTTTLNAPSATNTLTGVNAEWIVEDFSSNGGLVPLSDFSPCTWTASYADESSGGTIDAYSGDYTVSILENSSGQPITSVAEGSDDQSLVTSYTG